MADIKRWSVEEWAGFVGGDGMITVSFCCNDPDNGNFDGHVQSIEIQGEIHETS